MSLFDTNCGGNGRDEDDDDDDEEEEEEEDEDKDDSQFDDKIYCAALFYFSKNRKIR